jgi:hypothetical protein
MYPKNLKIFNNINKSIIITPANISSPEKREINKKETIQKVIIRAEVIYAEYVVINHKDYFYVVYKDVTENSILPQNPSPRKKLTDSDLKKLLNKENSSIRYRPSIYPIVEEDSRENSRENSKANSPEPSPEKSPIKLSRKSPLSKDQIINYVKNDINQKFKSSLV